MERGLGKSGIQSRETFRQGSGARVRRAGVEGTSGTSPGRVQGSMWEISGEGEAGYGVGTQGVFFTGKAVLGLLFGWGSLAAE